MPAKNGKNSETGKVCIKKNKKRWNIKRVRNAEQKHDFKTGSRAKVKY